MRAQTNISKWKENDSTIYTVYVFFSTYTFQEGEIEFTRLFQVRYDDRFERS